MVRRKEIGREGQDKRTKLAGKGWTSEKLSQGCLGFVYRHLSILVTDADKGSISHQILE